MLISSYKSNIQNKHDMKFQYLHFLTDEFDMKSWLKLISQASLKAYCPPKYLIPYLLPDCTIVNFLYISVVRRELICVANQTIKKRELFLKEIYQARDEQYKGGQGRKTAITVSNVAKKGPSTAGLPIRWTLRRQWDDVITRSDSKSETISGFLGPNYTGQCT